jgi:hypothetical protein
MLLAFRNESCGSQAIKRMGEGNKRHLFPYHLKSFKPLLFWNTHMASICCGVRYFFQAAPHYSTIA